jgi:hypothetical protein
MPNTGTSVTGPNWAIIFSLALGGLAMFMLAAWLMYSDPAKRH